MAKLTARQAATAKPGRHSDGDGLILAVSKTGKRSWFLRFQIGGRRRDMALGNLGDLPLAQARERASELRALIRKGIDPLEQAPAEEEPPVGFTFTQAAARYIRAKRREWTNPKHARQWLATMKTYARPVIGSMPVCDITTEQVLAILSPIWNSKTETAKRVQGRIENILDYAAAMQWRDPLNPARWRGHLDKILPAASKVKRQRNGGATRHHPAMPFAQVPAFYAELVEAEGISAMALRFTILTACRTNEVLQARWCEIDLDAGVWTIPPARTKAKRQHRVPLADEALAILNQLPRVDDWVFPGQRRGRPLSNMALLKAMRDRGYGVAGDRGDYVPHGLRSSFRDWAGEVSSFPTNIAEAALGHVIGDKTEAAYARGDLFAKRRKMMEQWASWCTRPPAAVVDLDARRAERG
ncbi:Putative prophage CPS-53 integrase [Thiorhodovibrio winogradskyi]|uniref:Prophage CPS-53 integrase n=1 Tax=Thiorhodovibrio winogradskyi TaxID=77007 RepID=A0ABZ0SA87_9GAMM|nr:integrase arm-type DNA-binding domain-containing protein [Thiorhodovibrio winogradskyi]